MSDVCNDYFSHDNQLFLSKICLSARLQIDASLMFNVWWKITEYNKYDKLLLRVTIQTKI